MRLGSTAGQVTGPVDIQWITDKLKLLGITYGSDSAILTSWRERVSKLEKRLNMWQHRGLPSQGKVLIINTLGLSGLVYLGSVHNIPTPCLQSVNKLIFNFLWSGKTELINRASLLLPRDRGGLGITDLGIKLQALQLKRLQGITSPIIDEKWVYLARYWIGHKLGKTHPPWSFLARNDKPHFDLLTPPPREILPVLPRISNQIKTQHWRFTKREFRS